uniref:Uncharacterized protein n=1 Tax=Chromera velia CCMP2878 TaxID=1169474 RepID=A0A0G4HNM2_9ALVE|eukprot:Cvel_7652.t1-p1 / transcript=Cvel_7652.t1 / gene=Cvel_7652 / organism=Chromera_velia_CCMP2878 / gene_product=hypothetical protein / transcript_product=hypothetical protein / location=Cvel_scaffold405:53088-55826(-) / protein_length=330 / sequence_SO=supercontig / SO=protein_coding / is_pseudo=false
MNGGITPFDSAVRNPLPSSSAKDVIWSVGKTAIVTRELDCQSTHPLAVVTPTYDSGFPGPGVKFLSGPSPLTPLFGKKGGHISVEEVAKAGEMFVSGTFVTVVPEPEGALAPDFYAALHIRVHRKTGTSLTDTNGGKESLGEGGDTLQGERVADVVFGVQSPQESLDSFYVSGKDPTQVEVFEGAGPVIFRRPVEVLVKSAGKAVSAGNVMFRHSMDDVVEDVPQTAVDAGGSPLKLREKLWKVQFRLGADGKVSVAAVRRLTYIAFDFDHTLDLSNFADCEMEIDVLGLQGQEKGKRQLILGGLSVESEPCLTSPGTPNVPAPASNGTM